MRTIIICEISPSVAHTNKGCAIVMRAGPKECEPPHSCNKGGPEGRLRDRRRNRCPWPS